MNNKLKREQRCLDIIALYESGHNVTKDEMIEAQAEYIQLLKEENEYSKELIEEYRYEA